MERKGNQNVYFGIVENGNGNIQNIQQKWSDGLNDDICFEYVTKAFKCAKKFSPTVYQQFNQYKLIHRRTVNNKLWFKMGLSESDRYLFCLESVETIEDIYLECDNVKQI